MSIYLDRGDICSNTVWNFSPTNCTLLWIWKAVCDDHVKECHYSMFFNWEEKFSVNWVGEASNQIIWEKSNKQRRMLSRSMSLQIGWDSNGERFWSNIPCHYWPCFRRPVTIAWWLQPGPLCIENGFYADISWQTNLKWLLSNFSCSNWP